MSSQLPQHIVTFGFLLLAGGCAAQMVVPTKMVFVFGTSGKVQVAGENTPAVEIPDAAKVPRTTEQSISDLASARTPLLASGLLAGGGSTRIVTNKSSSAVIVLPQAGTLRMGSDTEIKLPAETDTTCSLELLRGRLFMDIQAGELKKRGGAEFRLKTPAALLAVKGTRFFAIAEENFDTAGVTKGEVAVFEPVEKKITPLRSGQAVAVKSGATAAARTLNSEEKGFDIHYEDASCKRSEPKGAEWGMTTTASPPNDPKIKTMNEKLGTVSMSKSGSQTILRYELSPVASFTETGEPGFDWESLGNVHFLDAGGPGSVLSATFAVEVLVRGQNVAALEWYEFDPTARNGTQAWKRVPVRLNLSMTEWVPLVLPVYPDGNLTIRPVPTEATAKPAGDGKRLLEMQILYYLHR